MAKIFAVTIILIAIGSAIPIVMHTWQLPQDISTHGPLIDEQYVGHHGGGGHFLPGRPDPAGLLHLEVFQRQARDQNAELSRRSYGLGDCRVPAGGNGSFGSGSVWSQSVGSVYFTPPAADAMPVQVQAGQFAFYFRYPGPDGKFGPMHPDQINEANANFFGLDTTHDPDSKDDIVTAEMAIPVNREIHLLMHSKDVGHSFFVPELRVQQDFVPGLDLSVHFTATKVGKYEIVCTQLCGLGHYNMKAYLEVM